MKYLYPLLIFIGMSFPVRAQINYEPGLILDAQGNSVEGLLKYQNPKRIAQEIQFRAASGSKSTPYRPEDIQGFRYENGGYYLSKEIQLEGQATQVFLEFLVEGEANLYLYRDQKGLHYFIELEEEMVELTNEELTLVRGETEYVRESQAYKQTLQNLMKKAPELKEEITDAPYEHRSLVAITTKYHDYTCEDKNRACIVYSKDTQLKPSLEFQLSYLPSQVQLSPIVFPIGFGPEHFVLSGPSYTFAVNYTNANLFGRSKRAKVHAGLGYNVGSFEAAGVADFQQHGLVIPLAVSYRFFTNPLSPFVRAGVSNYFFLSRTVTDYTWIIQGFNLNEMSPYQLNVPLSAGIEYRQNNLTFSLAGQYEIGRTYGSAFQTFEPRSIGRGITVGFAYGL